jgi:hypothetical protein
MSTKTILLYEYATACFWVVMSRCYTPETEAMNRMGSRYQHDVEIIHDSKNYVEIIKKITKDNLN